MLAAVGTAAGTASASPAAPVVKASASAPRVPALPKSGIWTIVSSGMTVESPAPAMWVSPNGTGWDVFARQFGPNNFSYEAVQQGLTGGVKGVPTDIFAKHWGSLQFGPALLGEGAVPVLVFSGLRGTPDKYNLGCVYGAVGGPSTWTLTGWSLSSDCHNPVPAAAETSPSGKTLAAAWPGFWATGTGINYRIGVAPGIPAATPDKHIPLTKATAAPTGMADDMSGSGHFFVGWNQVNSVPAVRDGVYVEDVTALAKPVKAPDTGTVTVSNDFPIVANLAITNSNFHSGVFLAYCSNASTTCRLLLWRVGAVKPVAVPGSAHAFGVSVAKGPQGRIWVAWYNSNTNQVFVTRTNKADTRFGVVRSYATPCIEHGLLGLAGTPLQRLNIGMSCVNAKAQAEQLLTEVRAGLTLGFASPVHVPSTGLTIKITVSDAGDPVQGATVKVDGKTATTNSSGQVKIHLPGGIKKGKYGVIATAPNYLAAGGTLTVN
jgi:hypothetical protein